MEFRRATINDLPQIMKIMEEATAYLKLQGSPQWQDGNGPTREKINRDIEEQNSYVLVRSDQIVVGTIALIPGIDPVYTAIKEGSWQGEGPYLSLHRVAINRQFSGQGLGLKLLEQAIQQAEREGISDFRIDTHVLNLPMQKAIRQAGFDYRGVVHFPIIHGERLAYQKRKEQNSN
ncbi:GNAT family N-acetyltransferase [Enterococcus sp. LJL98]